MFIRAILATVLLVVLCLTNIRAQQSDDAERETRYRRYLDGSTLVRNWRVEPNWLPDGNRFWFESSRNEAPAIYLVTPAAGRIEPLDVPPDRSGAPAVSPLEPEEGEHFHQVLSPDGRR